MKKVFNIIGLTLIAATLTLVGCRKKETVEVDNETQSAVDDAVAYQEYASIMPTVNNHAVNTKGTGANNIRSTSAPCNVLNFLNEVATATVNGKVFPAADTNLLNGKYIKIPVYQLDFSNAATTCSLSFSDGKVRTGIWTVYFTGPLTKAGSQVVIKLQNHKTLNKINYACDSIIVTTVTNNTVVPKYIEYNVKLVNGVCTTSDWTIKYTFDRTFKHYPNGVSGNTDPVTMMWGTANGITRQGKPFTVTTEASNPLVKHKSCEFIDKGATSLTPEGFKTRTVDFGNGTCDDKATFTVNGNTVEFKLK